ncbi:MAG TPA: phosphoglucomutase, alpha-D-glucose phosphate-specific, partial [Desulfomonilia bacterium]|nr:phosphoglucomutase, alpha-D-glucose phosphate-specific [Desulfomonilia bacterium]
AVTGKDPHELYRELEALYGAFAYERIDVTASPSQKSVLAKISPELIDSKGQLAGDAIVSILTSAPANSSPIGGIKVITEGGWFAARPSGTEDIYKIYAESFKGSEHLKQLQDGARVIINQAFAKAGI